MKVLSTVPEGLVLVELDEKTLQAFRKGKGLSPPKLKGRPTDPSGGKRPELTVPHIRVLQVLAKARGPLTRTKISNKCGNKTGVVVGRAVGYSDPVKRTAFENSKDGGYRPSLLTLGYVCEIVLDVEGVKEIGVEITEQGLEALRDIGDLELPPLR